MLISVYNLVQIQFLCKKSASILIHKHSEAKNILFRVSRVKLVMYRATRAMAFLALEQVESSQAWLGLINEYELSQTGWVKTRPIPTP